MVKIKRVIEHNDVIFKENDTVKVTLKDGRELRGRIRIPTSESIVVDICGLSIAEIMHIQKIN